MSMLNFELISVEPSNSHPSPREIARERVSTYRAKQSVRRSAAEIEHVPDLPPETSIRRVFYAASVGQKRTVWERIKGVFGRLT